MLKRVSVWLLSVILVLSVSVSSFASPEVVLDGSVASASEISDTDVPVLAVGNGVDTSVSGKQMESGSEDSMGDRLVVFNSADSSDSVASDSVTVPTWQEAVEAVKASRQVATASDADEIETYELTDEDYGISLLSSVGTVTNTVNWSNARVKYVSIPIGASYTDGSVEFVETYYYSPEDSSSLPLRYTAIDGYCLKFIDLILDSHLSPPSGTYDFSASFASDFSVDYRSARSFQFRTESSKTSVATNVSFYDVSDFSVYSGDFYISPVTVKLSGTPRFTLRIWIDPSGYYTGFSGNLKMRFVTSSDEPDYTSVDASISSDTYYDGVSSSLGSIGDTLEEIVETISLQLEALWNQMYNYIHVPQLAKLEEIRQAIENIRLDVDIDNTSVVNKLQDQINADKANTNQITNGYDKSDLTDSNTSLGDSMQQQDEQEQQIWEQIQEPLEEFEFSNPISQYLDTFTLFGNFLQDLFTSSGAFKDVINLSFVITIALMVVGLYRFKGGN